MNDTTAPTTVDFQRLLQQGHWHLQRGEHKEALQIFVKARERDPTSVEAVLNQGVVLKSLNRHDEAIACYRRALELKAELPEGHNNLGMALFANGDAEAALPCFDEAVRLRPSYARALANKSQVLFQLNRLDEAEQAARKAIEVDPKMGDGHMRLGLILMALNRLEETVACFRRQVECEPNNCHPLSNLGVATKEAGRMNEALAIQAEAQALNPKDPTPYWNEAHVRLLQGDFAVGWERYEARWGTPDFKASLRPFAEPQWRGEPLGNRALLLHLEQGVGDSVMFSRLIRTVAELNPKAELIFEVQPTLYELMRHSFRDLHRLIVVPHVNVVGVNLPPFDLHIPLAGLCRLFVPRPEKVPLAQGYLEAPAPLSYRQPGDKLVVGISWHSVGATGRKRSIALQRFAAALQQPGVRLIDLQYGDTTQERAAAAVAGITLLHDDSVNAKKDLAAHANQVAACDLVISIDNTTVHMAGALGVPAWVLLHYVPDWRWMLRREDTPWYQSLKLLRQPTLGNWEPVLERVRRDLAALLAGDQTLLKATPWVGPPATEP